MSESIPSGDGEARRETEGQAGAETQRDTRPVETELDAAWRNAGLHSAVDAVQERAMSALQGRPKRIG
ncbi:hypothetical protein COY05_00920 [Candidatus Peregrinibacteria bacterium CG_4_10_14_0_2_um_filter_38_24]|nr:MAG: hypothetical protein COY05_00920 [Candidatus Peregrinibacteria bacterium CG_4_10_14_0_2_um_filter_38_24]PJC38746.1 MAG: hypothetical protein CO044_03335 [Candidatus Peregrinibacteria bacterium CG_4_9_14_0_2_um_filter_38_9]